MMLHVLWGGRGHDVCVAHLLRMQLYLHKCRLTCRFSLGRALGQLRLELHAPDQELALLVVGDVDAICATKYLQGVVVVARVVPSDDAGRGGGGEGCAVW